MLSAQALDGPQYALRRERNREKEAWLCESDSATSLDCEEHLPPHEAQECYFKRMQRLLVEAARKEHTYERRKADSKMRLFSTECERRFESKVENEGDILAVSPPFMKKGLVLKKHGIDARKVGSPPPNISEEFFPGALRWRASKGGRASGFFAKRGDLVNRAAKGACTSRLPKSPPKLLLLPKLARDKPVNAI